MDEGNRAEDEAAHAAAAGADDGARPSPDALMRFSEAVRGWFLDAFPAGATPVQEQAWEAVEDHRQHMDERGRKEGGTPYWLPGDTWRSEPRYTEELGPLPDDALLERPERPLDEYKADKRREVSDAYASALTATLTMPAANPSALEVTMGAALFAADDAVGLADVQKILTARRDALFALVDGAASRAELGQIEVSYPV